MREQTVFCKHYRAMTEHKTCSAGVAYEQFSGVSYDSRPCFSKRGEPMRPGCESCLLPTEEELRQEDAEIAARFEKIGKARQAIVNHLGGPWKKGTQGAQGQIDCPACGTGKLSFSRAGYNGHIHARCSTQKCVSWME